MQQGLGSDYYTIGKGELVYGPLTFFLHCRRGMTPRYLIKQGGVALEATFRYLVLRH